MRTADVLAGYAAGLFPMDDPAHSDDPLPWYVADPRAVLELDPDARAALHRRVRRSVRRCAALSLARDRAFARVLAACAQPRNPGEGTWITPRLASVYADLHDAGFAHSYELWDGGALAAGILAVRIRGAAMLESMFHVLPDAGNALLARTLDELAAEGAVLCDIQLPTDHTLRLGARLVTREEYERRLRAALGG